MPLLILIADDDPGVRLAIGDYLELSGYSVIAADNGKDALSLLEHYHPHLLISDIKMPQKDGYDLVRQVRQRPKFRLLPVIFLTQRNTTDERIQGYKVGCDIYLPKPFEMEELGVVIRSLLERSQIMQTEMLFKSSSVVSTADTGSGDSTHALIGNLSKREHEVLNLLSTGLSNGEIGTKLHLSPRTIEKYVSSLLSKTSTNNRAELVRFALENHLIN